MSTVLAPLVPKQVEAAIQNFTLGILGISLDPTKTPDPAYRVVRIGWQQQGQPSQNIEENVVYVRAVEDDDEYNRQRDVEYLPDPAAVAGETVLQDTTYVRVWKVFWCVYGPNSFDNARKLRSGLFLQDFHDLFAGTNLYLVTDPSAPRRVPEEFQGQWWERVDFEARFNEGVTEEVQLGTVETSEIIVETENGIVIDEIISAPPPPIPPVPPSNLPPFKRFYPNPTPEVLATRRHPNEAFDGVRQVFTFNGEAQPDAVQLSYNGALLCPTVPMPVDYTIEVGGGVTTITLSTIKPNPGDVLMAYY